MAGVGWLVLVSDSCCEGADFDEVVNEDAVSAPGSGAVDAGEFGAVPAVAAFEVVDPSFGSGAPFDLVAEGAAVSAPPAAGTGFARPGLAPPRPPGALGTPSPPALPIP